MTEPDGADRGLLAATDAVWRAWVARQVLAAYSPDDGRLLEHSGGEWWRVIGEDRLLDADAVRNLVAGGGWTLTGALAVELYGGRYESDDGEITEAQLARIQALVRDRHGNAVLLTPPLFDDEADTRPNLLDCSDEQLERTRRIAAEWSDRHWPALAALAHELGPEDRPSVTRRGWLWAQACEDLQQAVDPGKWCVFRDRASIDSTWELVRAPVAIGRLYAAKCSSCDRADDYGGVHVICVYCPNSQDLEDVRAARAVLRALGIEEELGYKTDRATAARLTGDAEWMLRE